MSTEVTFVPAPLAWEHAFKSQNGLVGEWMKGKVKEVERLAVIEAPGPGKPPRNRTGINYATGRLEESIYSGLGSWGSSGEVEGIVGAKAKHALFVHAGTLPHVILPRHAKILAWKGKSGKMVFATKVHHPGTMANPFLDRALKLAIH